MHLERGQQLADDVGMRPQHLRNRLAEVVRLRLDTKNPIPLVVEQRQGPRTGDGEDAIAHSRNNVAEKRIGGLQTSTETPTGRGARASCQRRQLHGARSKDGTKGANDVPELNSRE